MKAATAVKAPLRRLDPYLQWAALTGGRYLAGGPVALALRPVDGVTLADLRAAGGGIVGLEFGADCGGTLRATMPSIAGLPEALAPLTARADLVLAQPGLCAVQRTAARGAPVPPAATHPASQPGSAPLVIGVIDGACGFLNERFQNAYGPRVGFFWDQGAKPAAPPWRTPAGLGYGRELTRDALQAELASGLSPAAIARKGSRAAAEAALYARLGQDLPQDADWSHGTHILGTVLDNLDAGGVPAPGEVEIVYVQLPAPALRDTSAHWTAACVTDALRYIVDRAAPTARIVVNLSLGAFAGPHDGSSVVERTMDALIEELAGRLVVVVAAGNAGAVRDDGTGEPRRIHACGTLSADGAGRSADLVWSIDRADETDSFLEIWLPEADGAAGVEVALIPPSHSSLAPVRARPGDAGRLPVGAGNPAVAAVFNGSGPVRVPNGRGALVLVALGHTSEPAPAGAPLGDWTVRVTNLGAAPVAFDAWIERRDVPGELLGERPQYGFRPATPPVSTNTLCSLANGLQTLVVGAVDLCLDADGRIMQTPRSDSCSRGPADELPGGHRPAAPPGLDLFAAGKCVGPGFLTGSSKELAGTSVAAAMASGTIAARLRTHAAGTGTGPASETLQSGAVDPAAPATAQALKRLCLDELASVAAQRAQVLGAVGSYAAQQGTPADVLAVLLPPPA